MKNVTNVVFLFLIRGQYERVRGQASEYYHSCKRIGIILSLREMLHLEKYIFVVNDVAIESFRCCNVSLLSYL